MPILSVEDMTPQQLAVIDILVNEGKLRAYEELLAHFSSEHAKTASEDPYYGHYVKDVIEYIEGLHSLIAAKE